MANKKSAKNANAVNATPSIADQPTQKKISFFSAMLIVMGSCIGAGIFFKAEGVLSSSGGSLVIAILAWLIAAFAVIAMALALVEIASARNDNLSLIGWCKVFSSRAVYKASKNFMTYIYLPLTYFFMPFYVILSLQDAIKAFSPSGANTFGIGDGSADWVIWFLISIAIAAFFIFVSGLSSRAGDIMNKLIMGVKFIPLFGTIILGFVILGMQGASDNLSAGPVDGSADLTNFGAMTPGLGLFMAVGAIFFAYDGFYVTAGIQTEMKEPKKTPLAIVFGLGATTVIYLLIAISMSLVGDGTGGLGSFKEFLKSNNAMWVYGVLNLTIAFGVLGIINGFAMWAPRFVEDLIKENELPYSQKYKNRLNANKPWVGIWYSVILTIPVVIVFTIIGACTYPGGIYAGEYNLATSKLPGMDGIYNFCDLTGTWTAVIAFLFIMLPIAGGIKNRKQHFVKTEEKNYFLWSAWVSVIAISVVVLLLVVDAFVNVFLLINIASHTAGFTDMPSEEILGRVMKLVTLFIYVGLMFIPTVVEDKIHIKKYGSIEKYEKALGLEPTMKKVTYSYEK